MHNTRGRSKKRAEEKEKEEGGQKREIETFTDSEIEQTMGDKEEIEAIITEKEIVEEDAQGNQPDKAVTREEPNWQDMMKFMAEQFRKQEENAKQTKEETKESLKQTNESLRQIKEDSRKQKEELNTKFEE